MIKIGQKVHFVPAHHHNKNSRCDAQYVDGIVTYVHKRHWWYMVDIITPYGSFRECRKLKRKFAEGKA